ncbi:MAG: 3-(3-hydroxy-phenyl)propionate/3-hydroxycinnamic acid hydroxylase [Verrucomicrobiae bacterium]|nr:3-(3-hydroxy-phenyl)propionate/3-hydroxycinnamic acid hydroxylase [Verrucomicrobiae bacterium]
MYTRAQRAVALAYGIVCHGLYVVAVGLMGYSFYNGLTPGHGHLPGVWGVAGNTMLLLQFPILHSWLLTNRGRALVARLAPLKLGRDLATTTFAIIAALQLIAVFFWWTPSGHVWWKVGQWMVIPATGAWLFLVKSIFDSDMRLQTGFLGWGSVVRNRRPDFKPFSTRGVYRYTRQPIYLSFALILWTSAVWTPDQLTLAILWTGYCVVGAALKERRFLAWFGEAYRNYQQRVPFFLPGRPRAAAAPATDCDVLIVGAGPVGLLLANLLGKAGVRTIVVERRTAPPSQSMAIGITPPSLEILEKLGLADEFVQRGVRIHTAHVTENGRYLGHVDFSRIQAAHQFILSLPQVETVGLLWNNLRRYDCVQLWPATECTALEQHATHVEVQLNDRRISSRYVVGCDGHRSRIRELAGIPVQVKTYRPRFLMADFADESGLGAEAHLFFTARGSVESFPLPGGRRRWIAMITDRVVADADRYLVEQVRRLTGYDLRGAAQYSQSAFQPQRLLARRFYRGRVVLCGDAAHVMSPIGGQGMNTGFADAELLANVLTGSADFRLYETARRRAFLVAAGRAARGMWLGTRRGAVLSELRARFIRDYLFRGEVRDRVAAYFAMLTIPLNPVARR